MNHFLFQAINSLALKHLWLDALAIFSAKYLAYLLGGALFLLLLWNFKRYFQPTAGALAAAAFAGVVSQVIRFLWHSPRPFVDSEQVNLLLTHSASSSFPSLHAALAFALSASVFLYNKKIGILFFLASFLISASRIFCGLHWPSDILAGIALGIFSALLIHKFFRCQKN